MENTHLDPGRAPRSSDGPPDLRSLGDYRFLRRLGEGGMGAVYLGWKEGDETQVAVKVLNDQLAGSQSYIDRFYREAKSGKLLNHPNIVRTLHYGQDEKTHKHYLVMEYVDGPSAQALLNQFGRLSVGDAVHVVLDVARALEHAHSRNIIHRDIKPDNILITRSGVAKLADLGLAKRTDEASHLTSARQGFGTTHYMPYEQAVNARSADHRGDIYALGATLYHLCTGAVPFTGDNHLDVVEMKRLGEFPLASSLIKEAPNALDAILARMMARQPRDRYQTASELIVELERSRLATTPPSFADPDLASKDPWVQACLASSADPTRSTRTCRRKAGAAPGRGRRRSVVPALPQSGRPDVPDPRHHRADCRADARRSAAGAGRGAAAFAGAVPAAGLIPGVSGLWPRAAQDRPIGPVEKVGAAHLHHPSHFRGRLPASPAVRPGRGRRGRAGRGRGGGGDPVAVPVFPLRGRGPRPPFPVSSNRRVVFSRPNATAA